MLVHDLDSAKKIFNSGFKCVFFNHDEIESQFFKKNISKEKFFEFRKKAFLNYTYSYNEVDKYGYKYLHFSADFKKCLKPRQHFKKYDIGSMMTSVGPTEFDRYLKAYNLKIFLNKKNVKNYISIISRCQNLLNKTQKAKKETFDQYLDKIKSHNAIKSYSRLYPWCKTVFITAKANQKYVPSHKMFYIISYNIKLLTDNAFFKNEPWYDEEHVMIVKDIGNINDDVIKWCQKPLTTGYKNIDCFKTKNIFEEVLNDANAKAKLK